MYKTISKFLQGVYSRKRNIPEIYPSSEKGSRSVNVPRICPYCNKPFEYSFKYHKTICPVFIKGKNEIVKLQKVALRDGNKWVEYLCVKCRRAIYIHVDWQEPPIICDDCKITIFKRKNNVKKVKVQTKVKKQEKKKKTSHTCSDVKSPVSVSNINDSIIEKLKQHFNGMPDKNS